MAMTAYVMISALASLKTYWVATMYVHLIAGPET
jgi:hypothetical protein